VQADLLHACSYHEEAINVAHQVWAAVANETASAVRYGLEEHVFQSSGQIAVKEHRKNNVGAHVNQTFHHRKVKVEVPVRVDFVGGWSDTPPWSLEYKDHTNTWGTMLQMGYISVTSPLSRPHSTKMTNFALSDMLYLLQTCLGTGTDIGHRRRLAGSDWWSISWYKVMSLLASPRLITELQERLLVVFTRQLAKTGREALMNCNIDELGDKMMETWRLHQELDPHCSNELVDSLFAFADRYCCGYKHVGAEGGGFALLLAKNVKNGQQLRQTIEENNEFDAKVYNSNVCLEN
nr:bifunctional fucokinase/fucose pyrophosphorylase [Tanacetum cinerariifolium]